MGREGGGWSGWRGRGGVDGRLYLPIGLFGVGMSPANTNHRHTYVDNLHGSHCLSCDYTWLAKSALEKQTSQLSRPGIATVHGSGVDLDF